MPRDWDREEMLLRIRVKAAFAALMGIDAAVVSSGYNSRYTADAALEAYQGARADLAGLIDERRSQDPNSARP